MTKAKTWAARIGLYLFSLVITLLLGEFVFRWKVSAWPFEKPASTPSTETTATSNPKATTSSPTKSTPTS